MISGNLIYFQCFAVAILRYGIDSHIVKINATACPLTNGNWSFLDSLKKFNMQESICQSFISSLYSIEG